VTGDEIGLHFYTDDEAPQPKGAPASVFSGVDQNAMIARIDAVDDDDLGSTFFADSMQDVEDAAANIFDIGIKTLTVDPRSEPTGRAFGSTAPAVASDTASSNAPASADPASRPPQQAGDFRRAFILGGPAAAAKASSDEDRESPDHGPDTRGTR
jgi:hypothetical protein